MSKSKVLRKQLQKRPAPDLDPEDDSLPRHDQSSSDQDSGDENDGRDHYEVVGKSSLRPLEEPGLDSKYSASVVSRATLQQDDIDDEEDPFAPVDEEADVDPFAVARDDDDASDYSDEDEQEGKDRLKNGVHRLSLAGSQEQQEEDSDEGMDMYDRPVMDSRPDISSDEDEDDDPDDLDSRTSASSATSSSPPSRLTTTREKMKSLNKASASSVAASLSAAAHADIRKGFAIRKQQTTYDRLLDARIKLQKGLNVSNDIDSDSVSDKEIQNLVEKAEAAALSLWNTITSIRTTLQSAQQPSSKSDDTKRKRSSENSLSEMWDQSQSLERLAMPNRRAILNKWSTSTRSAAPSERSEPSLSDTLDTYLVAETSKPAPDSSAPDNSFHYSDDPFYQSLLRDLIASRTQSAVSPATVSTLPSKLHPSGSSKKSVDTRASKGRKIRYTVHEKLQNFMAPEDRTTWSEAARREFFGSLFGQSLLVEDVADNADGNEAMEHQEAGLRLFRGR